MVQLNAITAWNMQIPFPPKRISMWHEARARCNTTGFAKDPIGLIEFVGCGPAHGRVNSMTVELHIPAKTLAIARRREPFEYLSAITGIIIKQPMSAVSCLESANLHIRADKQNQLRLRAEMTERDKEAIRAAGRDEDALPSRALKEKMRRECLYVDLL